MGTIRLALTRIALVLGLALLVTQAVVAQPAPQSAPTWRDPSPHQVGWVTVDSSVRLEVLDWGESGPPLVLLGCYLTGHAYDDFAPKLTNQFHVYAITRRGIGASDKPTTGYAVQRSANDVQRALCTVDSRTIFGLPFRRLESLNCRPPIPSCFCRMRRTCSGRYEHSRPH
jgi:pimeloyl-ACP methyl ester carboxylesterase